MALSSTCIKCGGTSFELKVQDKIKGARFKYSFIQCASCGGVVGVTEFFNTAGMLDLIAKKLGITNLLK